MLAYVLVNGMLKRNIMNINTRMNGNINWVRGGLLI